MLQSGRFRAESARCCATFASRHLTTSKSCIRLNRLAEISSMITSSVAPSAQGSQIKSKNFELKTEDFIKMMITQLQNQDPMEPAKNQELLAQMSQIGQLQSATTLQESLKAMVMQQNIAGAGNLIGKMVQGMNEVGASISGLVNSVRVEKDGVFLELDNGQRLALTRVQNITQATPETLAA
jgi:flagellar basal-body rod modification protein FlgD